MVKIQEQDSAGSHKNQGENAGQLSDVNYFFPSATIIIPGSPLPSKPAPYPKRVKRREPVGRPEVHPPAAVSPPAFRPVLCV